MTNLEHAVVVKHLPEILGVRRQRTVFREIQKSMNVDRPRMVLDCSNLRQWNRSAIRLLLCCLEEAMKRNGDVKLAGLPPGAAAILERSGVNRLFDIYETAAEAVNSFHRLPTGTISKASLNVSRTMHSHPEPQTSTYRLGLSHSGLGKVSTVGGSE